MTTAAPPADEADEADDASALLAADDAEDAAGAEDAADVAGAEAAEVAGAELAADWLSVLELLQAARARATPTARAAIVVRCRIGALLTVGGRVRGRRMTVRR
jgi:hypothetical protein